MAQREVKAGIVLGGRVDGSVNVIGAKLDELAGKADLLGEKWLRQGARIDQVGRQIINLGKESVSVYRNYEDGILETRSVLQGVYGNNELNKVMEQLTYGEENVQFSPYMQQLKAEVNDWTREKIARERPE